MIMILRSSNHTLLKRVLLYTKPVCTGLGDRLGHILVLSALARLHGNGPLYMEWCTEAARALISNPLLLRSVPRWTGFNYSLEAMRNYFTLPGNIRLFPSGRNPVSVFSNAVLVQWGLPDQLPPQPPLPWTSTLFGRTLRLGNVPAPWTDDDYARAYAQAGQALQPLRGGDSDEPPYVLVHFRSPDHNTPAQRDEISFCTRRVLHFLYDAGVYMKVISNNHSVSLHWMRGLPSVQLMLPPLEGHPVFNDFRLALGAAAIVQHASTGWSSFTSVPAMAKGIPLINTFYGSNHRVVDLLGRYEGGIPNDFYSCAQAEAFMESVVATRQP